MGFFLLVRLREYWSPLHLLASTWMLGVFLSPFFLVPLHFRWQSPRESSVILAFVTGLGSWVLALALSLQIGIYTYGL